MNANVFSRSCCDNGLLAYPHEWRMHEWAKSGRLSHVPVRLCAYLNNQSVERNVLNEKCSSRDVVQRPKIPWIHSFVVCTHSSFYATKTLHAGLQTKFINEWSENRQCRRVYPLPIHVRHLFPGSSGCCFGRHRNITRFVFMVPLRCLFILNVARY